MSDFYDRYVQQVMTAVQQALAAARATTPPNPTTAKVTGASVDPDTGARTILVSYGGGEPVPTMWGTAFEMAVQVLTDGDTANFSKLQDPDHPVEVLVVTSTSPVYISDMIVRS